MTEELKTGKICGQKSKITEFTGISAYPPELPTS